MSEVKFMDRDKEVRRLAESLLEYMEPEDVLDPDIENEEIDKSNKGLGFLITAEEVAEMMKFIIFTNDTKRKLSARMEASRRPLVRVPYRDLLAGMIYSNSRGKLGIPNAVKLADKLIKELYPVEGEL